jgi:tetratricopeptide (TPR) repeat protein
VLLDYERYETRSKKKKKLRYVLFFFFLAGIGTGLYFVIAHFLFNTNPLEFLSFTSPVENSDSLWMKLVEAEEEQNKIADEISRTAPDKIDPLQKRLSVLEEEQKKTIEAILKLCDESLQLNPLNLRSLIYHGFASYYRAGYESSFENRVPYLNQSVVSLRRALLIANDEMKPQIFFMLGRIYFNKREFYYDLAQRYLEQAVNLGYKGIDTYEYLVLINDEWGNTEKSIEYLGRAYEENKNDIILFHLAKSYNKVNRPDDAKKLLVQILSTSKDRELLKECQFLLGEIDFDRADYKNAEKQYLDILKTDENSAEAHFRLALIFEKTGDYAHYRYELRRTLENDPGHSGARSRF